MKSSAQLVKTTCQLCHLGCGMNVSLENGRIVKVEGMPEHPLNEGLLCPKGEAVIEYVYSPDRVKYPMKRDGDGWQRISWDEALDTIVDKMTEVKDTYGAKAFAVAIGMSILLSGSVAVGLIRRFCYAFGSPNCFSVESMCYRCRVISYLLTYGRFRMADPENSRCIILWGHNPTNSNPMITQNILRAKDNGATLIVIDPRRTPLAQMADIHLQPRPGTDCALILGLINVIVSRGLYDKEFVDKWTFGFDRLAEHAKAYTPSYVEKITRVPADMIEKVARVYATTGPACIIQGTNALDQHHTGVQNSRGVAILQAITGNVDVPGGFIRAPRLRENPIEMPTKPKEAAIGQKEFPVFYSVFGREFGEGQAMLLSDTLLTGEPYPIKMMIVSGSNPLLTWPDSQKVRRAFEKLDFLVVMDQFMSRTARMADMILPAATFLERTELSDYYSLWGLPYVMLRKKIIDYEECWPDLKFWFELAHRLGYAEHFPWKTIEEAIDYILEPSGFSVQKLTEELPQGVTYGQVKYKEYESQGFPTPSGKVELYSETLAGLGYHPMPTFGEPPESPESTPDLAREYPLILTTGARILEFCHSQHRNIPMLRRRSPEPVAEIDPATATKYGIADGDMVTVSTVRGSIEIKARVTEDIMPDVVCISHGWDEANVNMLTSQQPADPIIGYPAFKSLLCRVEKKGGKSR
jgi:formate dehydrogenase (coenzyme F420) alpha subunit